MTGESTFTALVARKARTWGFMVWTVNQTRNKPRFKMDKGVPDIIMIGWHHIIFVETKVGLNGLSKEQDLFRVACENNGGLYWVVYEMDDLMDKLNAIGVITKGIL